MGEIQFTCDECRATFKVTPSEYPWQHGWREIYPSKHLCRNCYNRYAEKAMIAKGFFYAKVDLDNMLVYNASDSDLHYKIAYVRDSTKSAWGNVTSSKLIRFIGPDGAVWSGTKSNWSGACQFKRIVVKPKNIAK